MSNKPVKNEILHMKPLSIIKIAMLAVMAMLLSTTNVKATLNLDLPAIHIPGSPNPSASTIAAALSIPVANLGTLLYKLERDTLTELGTMTGSYSGFYSPAAGTGTATIQYTGGPVAMATYLLAKDGPEGSYVWNISGWNGTETIHIADVFGQHAFSHVEFFGSVRTNPTPVPEPSTVIAGALLLLPFGASVMRSLRRRNETT